MRNMNIRYGYYGMIYIYIYIYIDTNKDNIYEHDYIKYMKCDIDR